MLCRLVTSPRLVDWLRHKQPPTIMVITPTGGMEYWESFDREVKANAESAGIHAELAAPQSVTDYTEQAQMVDNAISRHLQGIIVSPAHQLVLTSVLQKALQAHIPVVIVGTPVAIHTGPSLSVLEFACGLSLLTGVLFGVAPAWISAQAGLIDAVRNATRTTSMGASVLQRGLVVVQVGLSLVLLVVAGLLLQSLKKLEGTDLKLDARNRYIVHINPQTAGYRQTQLEPLYRTMEERLHALPGVMKVGIASYTPMEDNNNGWGV